MIVYAESSAIVAWLFREPRGTEVEAVLAGASHVFASDLTVVECSRAIHRAAATGRVDNAAADAIRLKFTGAAASWDILRLLPSIAERAGAAFPNEPIRSLDAMHIAWALHAKGASAELCVLSLDERIRRVGSALGFKFKPD